ncbi:ImmA/IrrE family metallo-endopeptidase [Brevibacterium linens]|uniref:ImmA/IrrE family metallo-endopeptidase n=1 Tax=Brevibacterium linens TaxID=1703 RepID=UPI003F8ADC14
MTSILKFVKRNDIVLDPSRITLARELRGLTKSDLAKALGVTTRTLQKYESEGAPLERAGGLAESVGVEPEFFRLPPNQGLSVGQGFFRSLRRATAAQRNSARAAATVGTELYNFITERFRLPELNIPEVDSLSATQAAQTLRAAWGRGSEPLPNLVQLAEANGVRVLSLPLKAKTVDAFSFVRDDEAYVFLSTAKTAERSRFDIAHELGHLVMHTRQAPTVDFDSLGSQILEKQADEFAAAFLMPSESLAPRTSKDPAVPEIMELKQIFKVSAMAMTKRLHDLGKTSDWGYRQNCAELAKRGFRAGEPNGISRERSRVFDAVFPAMRNKGNLQAEISEHLGVSLELIHQLTFAQVPVSVDGVSGTSTGHKPNLKLVHSR